MNRRRQTRCDAFTAVELVITIVILGIVSATVIPTLSRLADLRGGAALTMTIRDIRLAQSMAMSEQLRTWVVFDTVNDSYALYIEPSSNAGKGSRVPLQDPLNHGPLVRALDDVAMGSCTFSVVDIAGTPELEFDATGDPFDGNETRLTSDASLQFDAGTVIKIHGQTGFAELIP